jgi:UDP-N-acetylmuramoyl-tripeptide--D-alanyl-D-alanine ligase
VRFSTTQAAAIWKTRSPGEWMLEGAAVDSRRVQPRNLFVALPGARVDGHDFVADALSRGAGAAVVSRVPPGTSPGAPLFVVDDTLAALQRLAAEKRREAGFRLAAVTGSAGKTTTKELAAAILGSRFRTGKTAGNNNSTIGFPMAVLNLEDGVEVVAGEMGMSRPGEISDLSRTFEPEVAAITMVADAHREFFDSIEGIADAKWEILDGLRPGGTLVYNAGDERLARRARGFAGAKRSFGFAPEADVRASDVESLGTDGTAFTLEAAEGRARVRLPLLGRHQVANCLCAAAIAGPFGIGPEEVAGAVDGFQPPDRRGVLHRLASGALLLDDSYNASPAAVTAGLAALSEIPASRRIAVLGSLLELGPESPRLHREVGAAAAARVDWLYCVGELAREIGRGAESAGLPASRIRYFDSADQVAPELSPTLSPGDLVWVKGSRGVRLDVAADALAG